MTGFRQVQTNYEIDAGAVRPVLLFTNEHPDSNHF